MHGASSTGSWEQAISAHAQLYDFIQIIAFRLSFRIFRSPRATLCADHSEEPHSNKVKFQQAMREL